MGLRADIGEVTEIWAQSSWRMRAMLVIALFLSVSSLASLSEQVAKWKGFFKAGVALYQGWIRSPVADFLGQVLTFHKPSPTLIDAATIYALVFASFVHGERYKERTFLCAWPRPTWWSRLGPATGAVAVAALMVYADMHGMAHRFLYMGLALYVFFVAIALFLRRDEHDAPFVLLYLVTPPLVVCLAAAINAGLQAA